MPTREEDVTFKVCSEFMIVDAVINVTIYDYGNGRPAGYDTLKEAFDEKLTTIIEGMNEYDAKVEAFTRNSDIFEKGMLEHLQTGTLKTPMSVNSILLKFS